MVTKTPPRPHPPLRQTVHARVYITNLREHFDFLSVLTPTPLYIEPPPHSKIILPQKNFVENTPVFKGLCDYFGYVDCCEIWQLDTS